MLEICGIAFTLGDMQLKIIMGIGHRVIIPSMAMLARDLLREELRAKIIKYRITYDLLREKKISCFYQDIQLTVLYI